MVIRMERHSVLAEGGSSIVLSAASAWGGRPLPTMMEIALNTLKNGASRSDNIGQRCCPIMGTSLMAIERIGTLLADRELIRRSRQA